MPGGKFVTSVPGWRPRLPVTTVGPVLVTVAPARIAKGAARPRPTCAGDAALAAMGTASRPMTSTAAAARLILIMSRASSLAVVRLD
jgi:hypothetical protein